MFATTVTINSIGGEVTLVGNPAEVNAAAKILMQYDPEHINKTRRERKAHQDLITAANMVSADIATKLLIPNEKCGATVIASAFENGRRLLAQVAASRSVLTETTT